MEKRKVTWVPFTKQTKYRWRVRAGEYAFVGSEIIGAIYTFGDDEDWYGSFAGDRIGSCRNRDNAAKSIEHKWINGEKR